MDFETYWETVGSRIQVESHEERARLAWEAAENLSEVREDLNWIFRVHHSNLKPVVGAMRAKYEEKI